MDSGDISTPPEAGGGPQNQPMCAICLDRTRGGTRRLKLGHRVSVWLCAEHASPEFQARRGGHEFVQTLRRVWRASDGLTRSRDRALSAHLRTLADRQARPRPGSYAWPELRTVLESRFADGESPGRVAADVHARYEAHPVAPPSRRTLQRWHAERR